MKFCLRACRLVVIFIVGYLFVITLFPVAYAPASPEKPAPKVQLSYAQKSSGEPAADFQLIPDGLISLGSGNRPAYAIVVEKDTQTLLIYEHKDSFSLKHRYVCSTGKVKGKKQETGDKKTPEGVYFTTRVFNKSQLSPIYGHRAFVIDYPNLVDRKSNRNGNNIWIHGTNKPIKPRDSRGCVAMGNDDLKIVTQFIEMNRTPIIIEKRLSMVQPENRMAYYESLTEFLETWKTSFISGNKTKYMACYMEPSEELAAMWQAWDEIRTTWKQAQLPFDITTKNVSLLKTNPYVVALFDEVFRLERHTSPVGTKKLFLHGHGDTWKIVGEVYQPAEANSESIKPMFAALTRLDRLQKDHKDISELIAGWADAWSSKDITRYRACYAEDFHEGRMDLSAWVRYKERLNKRYQSIRVSVENLQIRQQSDRRTATFLQRYRSSGHRAVGMKTLRLKCIGGAWKIYREIWHGKQK
ncbi:MAG: L,D-transpeptidase family protein [Desulfobacterales bacterium]|nr:L,D-transpeptidase family protein [Desulfobacterales bacterium]